MGKNKLWLVTCILNGVKYRRMLMAKNKQNAVKKFYKEHSSALIIVKIEEVKI